MNSQKATVKSEIERRQPCLERGPIVEVVMVTNRSSSLEVETPPLQKQAGKTLGRKLWVTTFVVVGILVLITLIFLITSRGSAPFLHR
jgi:hypothetical protein